ncbi:MAG: hypothetical protein IKZ56_06095 [Bacteroidales bacterium]|nr:hypothetical protein [Bacteroidales bacterium]
MKQRLFATVLFTVLFFTACDLNYHQTIPYKKVDFVIYPNDPQYYRLNTYGGYEYFTGGISGIVVYRVDEWTFVAYDRSCSYDWEENGSWLKMHSSNIMLIDSLCGSLYNILDGTVISGPAKWPLREYRTRYDGYQLRVYN